MDRPETDRNADIDALRGIALIGILIVNSYWFVHPVFVSGLSPLPDESRSDQLVNFIVAWLFGGKFIIIFAFLFGWGLGQQLRRENGDRERVLRRCAILAVIGMLQIVFLFIADILTTYALITLLMVYRQDWTISQRSRSLKRSLFIATAMMAVVSVISILAETKLGLPNTEDGFAALDRRHPANYSEFIAAQLSVLPALVIIQTWSLLSALPAVLAGDLASRLMAQSTHAYPFTSG